MMMDFCGFSQGMASEFACMPEIPYTMHPLKKSPKTDPRKGSPSCALKEVRTEKLAFPRQRSPGPFGGGTPKQSEKIPKAWRLALRSPRVPKECATKSEKSPKRVRSCVFGLFFFGLWGALFGDSGAPWARDTLSDSFRTCLGFQARRARETSVPGREVPNLNALFFRDTRQGKRPMNKASGKRPMKEGETAH